MVRGEGHPRSNANEDLPSSSSCVNIFGIITWLKPIGEPQANALWKKFSFPPNVRVLFSSSGPRFVACTKEDQRGMNFMYWQKAYISERLRFPLPPLVHQFFHFTRLHLIHTHVSMIHVLLRVCVLNCKYDVRLGLEEVLYTYSIK